jgi:hypothetical protein
VRSRRARDGRWEHLLLLLLLPVDQVRVQWIGHVAAAADPPPLTPAAEGGGAGSVILGSGPTVMLLRLCDEGEEGKDGAFAGLFPYLFPDSFFPRSPN